MIGNTFVNTYKIKNAPLNDILMVKNLYRYNSSIPRMLFTHDGFPDWINYKEIKHNKSKYKNKKVILLIRDPRDLVVSNYYQKKYRTFKIRKGIEKKIFCGNISEFIKYEFGGLPNIIEYYNSWSNFIENKNVIIIKYEDLKSNPYEAIAKTIRFLNCNIDKEALLTAIDESSFEKMRHIEVSNVIDNSRLSSNSADNTNSYKTRKGKVGSYIEDLNDTDVKWINDYILNNLSEAFYFYKP
jgi:hypothetical protein